MWFCFTRAADALALGKHRWPSVPRCPGASPASSFEAVSSPLPRLHHWILPNRRPPQSYSFQCCLPSGEMSHFPHSQCGRVCRLSASWWGECGLSLPAAWSRNCRPKSHIFGSGVDVWSLWSCWSSACIWRRLGLGSRKQQRWNQVGGCLPAAVLTGSLRCAQSMPASPRMKGRTQKRTCVVYGSAIGSSVPNRPPCPPAGCPLKWQQRWHIDNNAKKYMDTIEWPTSLTTRTVEFLCFLLFDLIWSWSTPYHSAVQNFPFLHNYRHRLEFSIHYWRWWWAHWKHKSTRSDSWYSEI